MLVMKRNMVSAATLTIILASMITLAFNIQPVKASGTIYIRADGSIDPPTAPISNLDKITYTFTGNIHDEIVVERSNIIIDGAGHTLSGNRSGTGVSLCGTNNVTVRKTNVRDFYYGIYIDSAFYVVLSDNNISGNWYGIWLWASTNNTICGSKITYNTLGILAVYSSDNNIYGNIVADNNDDGIVLNHSPKNTLSENDISKSADEGIRLVNSSCNVLSQNNIVDCDYCGLWLENSANNSLVGNNVGNNLYGIRLEFSSSNNDFDSNIMVNNTYSFGVSGASLSDYIQEIDASNTVNGEPICYWVNKQDAAIPLNSGYVALVNCTNIAVENLTLENNVEGILLAFTANSTITRNIVLDNWEGIKLHNSSNNEVAVNNLTNNFHGIRLSDSSNNAISRNYIVSNNRGAFLEWSSEYNSIFGNCIVNNTYGIDIWTPSNNFIYHNNFVDNTYQVRTDNASYSVNIWDDGYPSGGNYWSDYVGVDLYSGPYQNESGKDGIGDFPRVIDSYNQDNYPLMYPWMKISGRLAILEPPNGSRITGPVNITFTIENTGEDIEFLRGDPSNRIDLEIEYKSTGGEIYAWGIMFWSTSHYGLTLRSGEKYLQTSLYDPSEYEGSVPPDFVGEAPYGEATIRLVHWKSLEPGYFSIGEFGVNEVKVTLQAYALTITATAGGRTDPVPGTYSYTANSSVQVTAIPDANYLFDYWELDSINVGSANPYAVLMDKNHTLKAVFLPIPPPLSVYINPLSASINVGESLTFTSTVTGGTQPYSYQWYVDGNPVSGAISNTWTFTPTTSGIYYIYLKVTDAKANTAQSDTARITVATVPVGGYSIPIQVQTKTEPIIPYIALIATLTAVFTKLRPKTKRKH